jgi:hypothetical protein
MANRLKVEEIPDAAFVFRRVPWWYWNFEHECASVEAFNDFEMSVDWDKYSTIDQSISREPPKDESVFGAVALKVGFLRQPDEGRQDRAQKVEHKPREKSDELCENIAHSEVIGDKDDISLARKLIKHYEQFHYVIPKKKA